MYWDNPYVLHAGCQEVTSKNTNRDKARQAHNEKASCYILDFSGGSPDEEDLLDEPVESYMSALDSPTHGGQSDTTVPLSLAQSPRVLYHSPFSQPTVQSGLYASSSQQASGASYSPPFSPLEQLGVSPPLFPSPYNPAVNLQPNSTFAMPPSPICTPFSLSAHGTQLEQKMVQLTDLVYKSVLGVNSEIRSLRDDLSVVQKQLEKKRQKKVVILL